MLNGKNKICKWCNKVLIQKNKEKPGSFIKRKFCNRRCVCLYNSSLMRGKPAHNRNRVARICKFCDEVKYVPVSLSNRPFCNVKCMSKWMSEQKSENTNHWQGGITEKKSRDNLYPMYKEWRKSVYKRDNYTCQICWDNTSGNLNAHHIKSRANYPELITDLNNGLTLCEKCHKEIHYGNKLQRT